MPTVEVPGTVTASQKKQIKAWWKKVTVNNPNGLQFRQVKMPIVGNSNHILVIDNSKIYIIQNEECLVFL